jgi:hypothetical protein
LDSINKLSDEVKIAFNNAIQSTENYYKEHLHSAENNDQLLKVGPMTESEAILFFNQYYKGTFPLYMLKIESKYFAYY